MAAPGPRSSRRATPRQGRRVSGELLATGGLLVLAVVYLLATRSYRVLPVTDPGPGFMPMVFGLGLAATALVGVVSHLRAARTAVDEEGTVRPDASDMTDLVPEAPVDHDPEADHAAEAVGDHDWIGSSRAFMLMLSLVAFYFLTPALGFVPSTWLLFVVAAMVLAPEGITRGRHLLRSLVGATVAVGLMYIVFVVWLKILLPTGILGF